MGIRCADHVTPLYPQKLALTSPTGGGRSVGIVRSRTKATEFSSIQVEAVLQDVAPIMNMNETIYNFKADCCCYCTTTTTAAAAADIILNADYLINCQSA
jgi:hypothetical protein